MGAPIFEWPAPDKMELWHLCERDEYQNLCEQYSRIYYHVCPSVILVPTYKAAVEMLEALPEHWLRKRYHGVRFMENALNFVWRQNQRLRGIDWDPREIFLWDWKTASTEFGPECGILAEVRIRCKGCEDYQAVPLTNRSIGQWLCMPCEALLLAARRMIRDRQIPEIDRVVDATEMATQGCCRRRRWTSKPTNWDKEDWFDGTRKRFKKNVGTIAILAGIAGPCPQDVLQHAPARLQRISAFIKEREL